MKDLVLAATKKTPEIRFNIDGNLFMKGRSLPENADKFYTPLVTWIEDLNAENVRFEICLDYFNSSSAKRLMDMFKYLDANRHIRTIQINWYFEEGDEDSIETAQIFEDSLMRTDFRYLEYSDLE